jgi:DNA-binding beta-propeller fold protein YncE
MFKKKVAALAAVAIVIGIVVKLGVFIQAAPPDEKAMDGVPAFEVDAGWPKLPNNWIMGDPSSIAIDGKDNVWVINRPRTLPADKKANAAPPILQFDKNGKYVAGWGGPADGYDWPDNEHSIYVDYKDRVWISGNNPSAQVKVGPRSDDMLLLFTTGGKFIKQFGGRDKNKGNTDTSSVNGPADIVVWQRTNEAFIADGYGNQRVLVLDADTLAFKRMWGAFGKTPLKLPAPKREMEGPGPDQFGTVHALVISNDNLVYIGDRGNSRIQVFTLDGKYIKQAFVTRTAKNSSTTGGLAFSPLPSQQFIYSADQGNGHVHILNRQTLEEVGHIGEEGKAPGDFHAVHHLAADSKGNIYTAEVRGGGPELGGTRLQRFLYKGMKSKS